MLLKNQLEFLPVSIRTLWGTSVSTFRLSHFATEKQTVNSLDGRGREERWEYVARDTQETGGVFSRCRIFRPHLWRKDFHVLIQTWSSHLSIFFCPYDTAHRSLTGLWLSSYNSVTRRAMLPYSYLAGAYNPLCRLLFIISNAFDSHHI